MITTVGVIGLGAMGHPIARHLLKHGKPLIPDRSTGLFFAPREGRLIHRSFETRGERPARSTARRLP